LKVSKPARGIRLRLFTDHSERVGFEPDGDTAGEGTDSLFFSGEGGIHTNDHDGLENFFGEHHPVVISVRPAEVISTSPES
jgi:hypothetical protein